MHQKSFLSNDTVTIETEAQTTDTHDWHTRHSMRLVWKTLIMDY